MQPVVSGHDDGVTSVPERHLHQGGRGRHAPAPLDRRGLHRGVGRVDAQAGGQAAAGRGGRDVHDVEGQAVERQAVHGQRALVGGRPGASRVEDAPGAEREASPRWCLHPLLGEDVRPASYPHQLAAPHQRGQPVGVDVEARGVVHGDHPLVALGEGVEARVHGTDGGVMRRGRRVAIHRRVPRHTADGVVRPWRGNCGVSAG